jgi:hypothetical protein
MSAAQPDPCYVVDASAFIDLRIRYPKDVFTGVWNRISDLAKQQRLISPAEVKRELQGKADEVLQWAKMRRSVFRKLDQSQMRIVREILQRFPDFVDPNKPVREADPFVVALAIAKSREAVLIKPDYLVVTHEKATPSGRPKTAPLFTLFQGLRRCEHVSQVESG